jgi:hypothetical protein
MMVRYNNIRDAGNYGKDNLHYYYDLNYVDLYFKTRVINIIYK